MLIKRFISPGLELLPFVMDTQEARVLLIAIGLQESKFEYRLQVGGPARGFWQFELGGGTSGVLNHKATKFLAERVCNDLRIKPENKECHDAIAYNDMLACAFARLLLWTLPYKLPDINDYKTAWSQYLSAWRPGRPHRETWGLNHAKAKELVIDAI